MNIHREPTIDDPSRSRVNLGLRRRIWWTAFVSSLALPGLLMPKQLSFRKKPLDQKDND